MKSPQILMEISTKGLKRYFDESYMIHFRANTFEISDSGNVKGNLKNEDLIFKRLVEFYNGVVLYKSCPVILSYITYTSCILCIPIKEDKTGFKRWLLIAFLGSLYRFHN